MSADPAKPKPSPMDRARLMRLWLHRRLDELYREITDPTFTGDFTLKLSAKCGRPGEPEATVRHYGATELEGH